jgi:serine/threonine protein kinase
VKSPHIVQFYGASLREKLTMVMELCDRGSLFHVMQDKSVIFTWDLFFRMMEQITLGIQCLHLCSPALFHRDLKVYYITAIKSFHLKLDFKCFGDARIRLSSCRFWIESIRCERESNYFKQM